MRSVPSIGGYGVKVKTTWLTFELERMWGLLSKWDQEIGYQVQEEHDSITLIFGKAQEVQLVLRGKKRRKFVCFFSGQVLGNNMNEEMLIDLLSWICNVQIGFKDTLGLIITKDGHHSRPLVIQNGELYDETRMMDILWGHFAATRVRESRRMEEVYHFLRDVSKN